MVLERALCEAAGEKQPLGEGDSVQMTGFEPGRAVAGVEGGKKREGC